MAHRNRLSLLQLAIISTIVGNFFGCAQDYKIANNPPSDLQIKASKCFVGKGKQVELLGKAQDADGDSLIFSWSATGGTITQVQPGAKEATWTAPSSPGTFTIRMSVTDEIDVRTIEKAIDVCEVLPTQILSSTTLASTEHPYITQENLITRIAGTATLTIEPGVVIVIDGPLSGIECNGRMLASGTSSGKIVFRSSACTGDRKNWGRIAIQGSEGEGTFNYCSISGGTEGIFAGDGARLDMKNCEIFDNEYRGVSIMDAKACALRKCNIMANVTGIYVDTTPTSQVEIRRCSIRYNSGDGIAIKSSSDDTQAEIDSCVIANNYQDGVVLEDFAAPAIHYCSIFANDEAGAGNYALRLAANTSPDSIHAERNYWGLGNNSADKIAALVYDRNDNPGAILAYVSFIPWLDEAPVALGIEAPREGAIEAWAR